MGGGNMVLFCAGIEEKLERGKKKKRQMKRQIIHAQGCMVSKKSRAAMISSRVQSRRRGMKHTREESGSCENASETWTSK
jgi:hypothetical protein